MTPPARPSVEIRNDALSTRILAFVGLVCFVAGIVLLVLDKVLHDGPSHIAETLLYGGLAFFGALVLIIGLAKQRGETVLKTIVVIVSPFVPKFGGGRPGDPPLPPPTGGAT